VVSSIYTVRLQEVFQGPMDLLLHLVREQEVEIHEVEISRVIEGYLAYLRDLRELDIELAGDFLVMAATLMSIKSRSLLPRDEVDLEEDLDPRDELIQRLIEYRRFKEASDDLGERFEERAHAHPRGLRPELADERSEPTLDLGELTTWDLLSVFSRLMRETLADRPHRVRTDPRPLRFYVERLAHAIHASGVLSLAGIVAADDAPSRESMVGSFCALLELVRMGLVTVEQPDRDADISIRLRPEHEGDIEDVVAVTSFEDERPPADEPGAVPQPADERAEGPETSPGPRASEQAGG
jgi:segregation and condensation protein A